MRYLAAFLLMLFSVGVVFSQEITEEPIATAPPTPTNTPTPYAVPTFGVSQNNDTSYEVYEPNAGVITYNFGNVPAALNPSTPTLYPTWTPNGGEDSELSGLIGTDIPEAMQEGDSAMSTLEAIQVPENTFGGGDTFRGVDGNPVDVNTEITTRLDDILNFFSWLKGIYLAVDSYGTMGIPVTTIVLIMIIIFTIKGVQLTIRVSAYAFGLIRQLFEVIARTVGAFT